MWSKLKLYLPASDFAKNVLTLMTGSTMAQAIPIGITPVLTRLYTPDDFGVLALFLAIIAITGAISNAKYEQSIVLPKTDNEAINILFLGFIVALSISVLLLLIIVIFGENLASLFGNEKIGMWLYFVPISTFFIGIYSALNYYNIRKKRFRNISISQVSKSTSAGIAQIVVGILQNGPAGLIIGQIVSYLSGNWILYRTLKEHENYKDVIEIKEMKILAKRYINFPKFSMPSTFINSVNLNIMSVFISSLFSMTTLGHYALTQRIIGIPSRMIRNNFSQVYLQKASEEYNELGRTERIFKNSLIKMVLLTIPCFTLLFLSAEYIFVFFFGEDWIISAVYAKILMPLAAVRFISGAFSVTLSIHGKQSYSLIINIILLSTTLVIFSLGILFNVEFDELLVFFVGIQTVEYLMFLALYWYVAKGVDRRTIQN